MILREILKKLRQIEICSNRVLPVFRSIQPSPQLGGIPCTVKKRDHMDRIQLNRVINAVGKSFENGFMRGRRGETKPFGSRNNLLKHFLHFKG